jgi:hypothetical protein
MSRGAAMALHETWVLAAPLSDGRWEVRCTRCGQREHRITADGAQQLVAAHQCEVTS